MSSFQVRLHGRWRDYHEEENGILKRAFMAGFPNAKFHLRGQNYQYDFKDMRQKNTDTGKERRIRAPYGWKAPEKPIVPPGPTTCIKVPPGAPGTTIEVPHPHNKSVMIKVHVPRTAKPGQAMLVPVPKLDASGEPEEPTPEEPAAEEGGGGGGPRKGYSTGAKVAMGAGGVAIGGLAVAGAILGAHAAEHGTEATAALVGDAAGAAGEAIGGAAGDAAEAVADAAEEVAGAAGDIDVDAVGDAVADVAGDAGEAIADVGGDAAEAMGDAGAEAAEFLAGAGDDIADFVMDLF